MNYLINFFELVLKKDHNKKDNPLYKAREKLEKIIKTLSKKKLSEEDQRKYEKKKQEALTELYKRREEAKEKLIPEWIINFSSKSETISKKPFIWGTHLSKFENAMNDYGCLNCDLHKTDANYYVSTSSIKHKTYDVAHSNGNLINFSRFLVIKDDSQETIFEKILRLDYTWLDDYISNKEKKIEIVTRLKTVLTISPRKPDPAEHKQIYFPVSLHSQSYQIVSPILSSSFCHELFTKVKSYHTNQKVLRKAKRGGLHRKGILVDYPNIGILRIGGDKPHNISPLNSNRYGQLVLLPAIPPQWQTQLKPPTKTKNIFNRNLGYRAKEPLEKLKKLLLAIKLKELSFNMKRKQLIAQLIAEISGLVFDRVAEIHGLYGEAGWSLKCSLPLHQQYWLDPFREDEEFQIGRADVDWQTDISNDFAKWVDWQIYHPKLTRGTAREKHWKKLFIPLLREFNAGTEAIFKAMAVSGEENA